MRRWTIVIVLVPARPFAVRIRWVKNRVGVSAVAVMPGVVPPAFPAPINQGTSGGTFRPIQRLEHPRASSRTASSCFAAGSETCSSDDED